MAKIKVTLVKSVAASTKKQIATVQALGLKKIGSFVEREDNACVRGQIKVVSHLVKVEAV
jgi:large subunit ribosomal protein L30